MNKWGKWWQRQILDSLMMNPPPPLTIILMGVFGSVFGVGFLCAHWMDQVDLANYKPFNILTDNIGGVAFDVMSDMLPVDVVYTWVNGSDEKLLNEIEALTKSSLSDEICKLKNCLPSNYYSVRDANGINIKSSEDFDVLKSISLPIGASFETIILVNVTISIDWIALQQKVQHHFGVNASIQQTYWTSDHNHSWSYEMPNVILICVDKHHNIDEVLRAIDPENYSKWLELCSVTRQEHLMVLECNNATLVSVSVLKDKIEKYRNDTKFEFLKVFPASLVLHTEKRKEKFDVNRFGDNEELRYSLRSLEKYAPWVRRIFLVTNGQVPYWLDLDHPKLTLVTHDQIFIDKSHLPTYSSPAIESHIHRIPGLSDHFIYFNDDIVLGAPVYPDDFYSTSSGYKIYLSWALPECSDGCPGSWIRDGYCDRACNNSECNWDGGDCTDGNTVLDYTEGNQLGSRLGTEECFPTCADSWLADGYCDPVCSKMVCVYDAGDCGVELLKKNVFEISLSNIANRTFYIPPEITSAWMNLSSLFSDSSDTDVIGNYERSHGVRIAAVNTQLKVVVWLFTFNSTGSVRTYLNCTKNSFKNIVMNMHFDTRPIIVKATESKKNVTVAVQHFNFVKSKPSIDHRLPESHHNFSGINNSMLNNVSEKMQIPLAKLNTQFEEGLLTDYGLRLKRHNLMNSYDTNITYDSIIESRKLLYVGETMQPVVKDRGTFETYRGHFPWEKYNYLLKPVEKKLLRVGRKLLDDFSGSLLFVNRLYNSEYGFEARKVPAHMPHYIDKNLLEILQAKFVNEFSATSSHKLRNGTDMQFAFSYYYFLMNEKVHKSTGDIFDSFDTDNSGTWSDREIRTFLAKTHTLPLRYDDVMGFQKDLKSCYETFQPQPVSVMPYERYTDSDLPTISKELIEKCGSTLLAERLKPLITRPKFRYTTITDPPVDFKMISSNLSIVIYNLDEVRKNNKKFICLNSDLDPRGSDNKLIQALVQDTYESLYPIASSFELPLNYRNRFGYIWEVKQWKTWRNVLRALIYASIACLLILVALTFFNNELQSFKRKLCKRRRKLRLFEGRV